jgi:hypothetical protein
VPVKLPTITPSGPWSKTTTRRTVAVTVKTRFARVATR